MSRLLLRPRLVSSIFVAPLRHSPISINSITKPITPFNNNNNNNNNNRKMSGLTSVLSHDAAPPAGPYSQAIKANGLVFVSGQIPADNKGNVIEGDIETCTKASLENLLAVLTAAGTSLDKVVKTTVFLADMGDFARVNSVYEQYFTGPNKPARSCVAVKTLPKNVRVEVECIALQ
ncbi:L-PSP endoribonuclease family protein [Peziza echinospora]|nr:L-PSP endoribonuclease family protein [Peziza echinospora]